MEEHNPHAADLSIETTTGAARWADLRSLALLAVLVIVVRAWQLTHTEVASRDSISYVRIAWQLEHGSWLQVMPSSPQHPGYPLAVLAMSLPVRQFLPDDLPRAWQISAQLVSAVASLLLIVPMFYLGRELFDRRIAFWACVLFQCLPTSGKIMGDGLSDPLFLLFACSGLWLSCAALRTRSWLLFALTGLAGGLAYLTRPEGAILVAAAGVVLVGMQLRFKWRQAWKGVVIQGVALSAAALVVTTPYMIVIRGLTVKNTPNLMMNQQRPDADWEKRLRPRTPGQQEKPTASVAGSSLFAIFMGPGDRTFENLAKDVVDVGGTPTLSTSSRIQWALKAFCLEASKGFFYVVWLPAVLGLWWRRDRFACVPGVWVGALVCVVLSALLLRMAEKMGYISDRHLLFIIMFGVYWAAAGALVLGEKLALGTARLWPRLAESRWLNGQRWAFGLLLLLTVVPLTRTLDRLHGERAGFRSLGNWLAQHTEPGDYIEDPYCWTYFYAGRVFVEGRNDLPASTPSCFYVVIEESSNRHPRLVSLQAAVKHVLEQRAAKIVHTEEIKRRRERVALHVWKVPGPYQWTPLPALPGQQN
jgi:hypothetical protein